MNRPRPHETHRVWVCHSAHEHGACCGVLFRPGEERPKTRELLPKSGGVLPKSPQFLLRCCRVFHRTGIVCFQPCATFFDRTWVFRSSSARFCFDRAFILCIFATIYYHHRTRSRKGHRLPQNFLPRLCRAGGLPRHSFTIRKIISLILFTAPAPKGDFPPLGEGNGGALPYDSLFTLLLCDALRTI